MKGKSDILICVLSENTIRFYDMRQNYNAPKLDSKLCCQKKRRQVTRFQMISSAQKHADVSKRRLAQTTVWYQVILVELFQSNINGRLAFFAHLRIYIVITWKEFVVFGFMNCNWKHSFLAYDKIDLPLPDV